MGAGDELARRFPLRAVGAFRLQSIDQLRSETARLQPLLGVRRMSDPVVVEVEQLVGRIERLCSDASLALVLDDLQWLDQASLIVWQRLARMTEQMPLLLVGAGRLTSRSDDMNRIRRGVLEHAGTVISLNGLAAVHVGQMVSEMLGGTMDSDLDAVIDRAAGNPLWISEVVDALVCAGAVTVRDGIATLACEAGSSIPTSVAQAVARRLEFLSDDALDVLAAASMLGTDFSVVELAAVSGRKPTGLLPVVEESVANGLLVDRHGRLAFRHPLIRAALYERFPEALLTHLHRHAARQLAGAGASLEAVTEQLAASGRDADDWLVDWLDQVMPALMARSPELSAELLSAAADYASAGDPRRERLRAGLARVLIYVGRHEEGTAVAREVLAGTVDPDRAANMRDLLTARFRWQADADGAITLLRQGLDQEDLSDSWRARLLARLAQLEWGVVGDLSQAEADAQRACEIAASTGNRQAAGHALNTLAGISSAQGDWSSALHHIDQSLHVMNDDPTCRPLRVMVLANRARALHGFDRMADAAEALRQAQQLAEHGGGELSYVHDVAAVHCFWTGSWDDALAELAAARDAPGRDAAVISHGLAALIAGHRGERAAARGALEYVDDVAIRNPEARSNSAFLFAARAVQSEQVGTLEGPATILRELLGPEFDAMATRYRLLPYLVRLALAVDDRALAAAAVRVCEKDVATCSTPGNSTALVRCVGLLDGNPAPLLEAAVHYRAAGCRIELAHTVEDAAETFARCGRLAQARALVGEAIEIYTHLGANWDIRRADARLRPYGIRRGVRGPRRRPARGWEALSPTEVTVAHLVAQGRSNPDIATELVLSRRTVQCHVSNILTKLGMHSRIEIARYVEELGAA